MEAGTVTGLISNDPLEIFLHLDDNQSARECIRCMCHCPVNAASDRSMSRFNRQPRIRRRNQFITPGTDPAPGRPSLSWWAVAAIGLLLISMPILVFNQQHSGDRLKIRRELRKF